MERQRLLESEDNEEEESVFGSTRNRKPPPTNSTSKRQLVNLEGSDWLLTTLLITLDALLLELYKTENTKWATFLTWFFDYSCHSGWVCQLVDTLFVMAVAVTNVSLLIPVLNVNVRTPSKRMWRFWLSVAWCSLLLVDTMTMVQFVDSVKMNIHGADVNSWTAHFWLVLTAVVTAAMLNIRFLYLYGVTTLFRLDGETALKTKPGLAQVFYNESRLRDRHIEERKVENFQTTRRLNVVKAPQLRRFNTGKFLDHVSTGFANFVVRQRRFGRLGNIQFTSRTAEEGSGDQRHLADLVNESWYKSSAAFVLGKIKHAYTEVAEVENIFEYSSWIKSAAIFTIVMLIYNCIKTTERFFSLASSWDDYHHMAHRFQGQVTGARSALEHLQQNLTDVSGSYDKGTITSAVEEVLPDVIQEVSGLQTTLSTLEKTTGSAYDVAGSMLDIALLTTAKLINVTDLKGNEVVAAFYYVDTIIPILRYTCMIGYPIGTLIGLHSLYQVLVQHKRMSLALEQALTARTQAIFGKEVIDEEDAKVTLLGIDKKYQIGGAVYFFGILMSTAVVQQHIFGFFVTMSTAVVVDIKNFDVLLNLGGYLLLVYGAVMGTNLVLTHVIGDRLLTKEGFNIRHPWLFFLYLFTFSMVHAVLGFLYALWRAILLLVTTFWVLNRLDVSLFLTGKQFDNGHYSFMSMLLLTRVIRLTNIAQGYISASGRAGHFGELTDADSLLPDSSGNMDVASASSVNASSAFRSQELAVAEEEEEEHVEQGPPQIPPLTMQTLTEIQVDEETTTPPRSPISQEDVVSRYNRLRPQ